MKYAWEAFNKHGIELNPLHLQPLFSTSAVQVQYPLLSLAGF